MRRRRPLTRRGAALARAACQRLISGRGRREGEKRLEVAHKRAGGQRQHTRGTRREGRRRRVDYGGRSPHAGAPADGTRVQHTHQHAHPMHTTRDDVSRPTTESPSRRHQASAAQREASHGDMRRPNGHESASTWREKLQSMLEFKGQPRTPQLATMSTLTPQGERMPVRCRIEWIFAEH